MISVYIIDVNDNKPVIELDYGVTQTNCDRSLELLAYEDCLFSQLNQNGVTYATLLAPYDGDRDAPNNVVQVEIVTNAMYKNLPLFTVEFISDQWQLRYSTKFDFCQLDSRQMTLKMCDLGSIFRFYYR